MNQLEVRDGFAQVHVSEIDGDVMQGRLYLLQAMADAGVSLDFLKLTPHGMSFLVPVAMSETVRESLQACNVQFEMQQPRSILSLYAVNIRDEEGMIADIVQNLISTGAPVDHLGDMHDRVLMVLRTEDVERVAEHFRTTTVEAA